ncbi:MAG: hypothetical protein ACOC2K_01320 [Bacteroidota bacterium]
MNTNQVKQLLEKFYDADTSIEEEKALEDFFHSDSIPAELSSAKAQFMAYGSFVSAGISDEKFRQLADNAMTTQPKAAINRLYYYISGAAAAVLITVGLWYGLATDNHLTAQQDLTKDEIIKHTRYALFTVSNNLEKGTVSLQKLNYMNEGVNKFNSYNVYFREINTQTGGSYGQ